MENSNYAQAIEYYCHKGLTKLSEKEKLELFNILQKPITYAIDKAFKKFSCLPIEKEDLQSTAWEVFELSIRDFKLKSKRKKFISYIIDAVYWKTMDVCIKYSNNKFRVINQAYSIHEQTDEDHQSFYQNDWSVDLGYQDILDRYFTKYPNKLYRKIFNDYVNGMTKKDICQKYEISRNKLQTILSKIVIELKEIFSKSLV
ncbi:sigma-70 family RNA polymerase sigma factor [Mesoplasma seiffertii]|uniref:sigma-70 family RNA polymerase sigma factor n=1 Tax=Mesoplasma seiffertii TaxID=28224 RepID=UPI00047CA7E2|nr:sigma-70 family RNA polymerase sigma factor [Mesoplasma seiffertii]